MFVTDKLNKFTNLVSKNYETYIGGKLTETQAKVAALALAFFGTSLGLAFGAIELYLSAPQIKIAVTIGKFVHSALSQLTTTNLFKAAIYPAVAGTATALVFAGMRVIHPNAKA